MALGGTYNNGMLGVTLGSASVSGHGVLWSDVVEGDWLQVGTAIGVIDSVNGGFDGITLKDTWAGPTVPMGTATMTIASPCVVTWPATAPAADTLVVLSTTGALAIGLTPGTIVYVKSPSGSTSNLSATPGGAAINTSGSQSGVHTIGSPYRILKMSWLRHNISNAYQKYTALVNHLETAALFGVPFKWDTGTSDADPGAGNIRANNALLSSASLLHISKSSRAGADVSAYLAALDDSTNPSSKGTLILGAQPNGEQAIFTVGAVTDATNYIKLAISGASGVTSFLAGDLVNFQFIRAGDNAPFANDNVAVNGAVDVSQELGTTGATLANNTAKYIADCWEAMYNHGAATAVVTSAQLAAASFPSALAGFRFGHQIKATTALTSPANGDFAKHRLKIEGYRIAHWGWGATGAAAIVVALELYSTASGTAFVKLSNSDQSRCYYHEITVAAGWNFYAFNVEGDTSGTWQATSTTGLTVEVFVAGKAATPASSLDAWGATNSTQTTNSTNLLASNNNQTIMTGLFSASGAQLPAAANLPLLMRVANEERSRCLRYLWYPSFGAGAGLGVAYLQGAPTALVSIVYPVEMRTAPTVTQGGNWQFNNDGTGTALSSLSVLGITATGCTLYGTLAAPQSGGLAGNWRTPDGTGTLKIDARL